MEVPMKSSDIAQLAALNMGASSTRVTTLKCLRFLTNIPGLANAMSVASSMKTERVVISSIDMAIIDLLGAVEGAEYKTAVAKLDKSIEALAVVHAKCSSSTITEVTWEDVEADVSPNIAVIRHFLELEEAWMDTVRDNLSEARAEELSKIIKTAAASMNSDIERKKAATLDRAAFKAQKRAEKARLLAEAEEEAEAIKNPKQKGSGGKKNKKKGADDLVEEVTHKIAELSSAAAAPAGGSTTPVNRAKSRAASVSADPSTLVL